MGSQIYRDREKPTFYPIERQILFFCYIYYNKSAISRPECRSLPFASMYNLIPGPNPDIFCVFSIITCQFILKDIIIKQYIYWVAGLMEIE